MFTLFLDEDSDTEQGWSMQCDDQLIWDKHVGHLVEFEDNLDGPGPYVRDEACVPETATCHFTIVDSFGDGLYSPGFFSLTYEATTVAVYDETHPFEELSYCFGPGCSDANLFPPPREIDDDCDSMYMYLQLDGTVQEEMTYTVKCDEDVIWHGLYDQTNLPPRNGLEQETCIGRNSCCSFTISDSGIEEYGGAVYLEWAYKTIIDYRGGQSGFEQYKEFGLGCPATPEENEEDDAAEGSPVTFPENGDETTTAGTPESPSPEILIEDVDPGVSIDKEAPTSNSIDEVVTSLSKGEGGGLSTRVTIGIVISSIVVALLMGFAIYRCTRGGQVVVADRHAGIKASGSSTSDEASDILSDGNRMD